jgi:hypothetical protein
MATKQRAQARLPDPEIIRVEFQNFARRAFNQEAKIKVSNLGVGKGGFHPSGAAPLGTSGLAPADVR